MKNLSKSFVMLFSVLALAFTSSFNTNSLNTEEGDKLMGVWEPSHGKARVKITKVGN
jgi:hypothetical protein